MRASMMYFNERTLNGTSPGPVRYMIDSPLAESLPVLSMPPGFASRLSFITCSQK